MGQKQLAEGIDSLIAKGIGVTLAAPVNQQVPCEPGADFRVESRLHRALQPAPAGYQVLEANDCSCLVLRTVVGRTATVDIQAACGPTPRSLDGQSPTVTAISESGHSITRLLAQGTGLGLSAPPLHQRRSRPRDEISSVSNLIPNLPAVSTS